MSRSFTVVKSEIGVTGGRYVGTEPYRVARKVARALFDAATGGKKKKKEIRFTIREMTEGSKKKEYHYIGMKKSLDKPVVVKRGDTDVTIRNVYHVKSCAA